MSFTKKYSPLELSKSLLFRTLTYRAAGFLGKPFLLFKIAQQALAKADKDASVGNIARGALDSVRTLVQMIRAYATGTYSGISKKNIVLVIAAVLYFVTPIDIVPDFLPFIGLLDDITLMGWVLSTLGEELAKYEEYASDNRTSLASLSYQDLYERAKASDISGRSGMSKDELIDALSA